MLALPQVFLLLLGIALLLSECNADAVPCNLKSGSFCSCDVSDGSGSLDLSAISKSDGTAYFPSVPGSAGWHYGYNPCAPFVDKNCKDKVLVCQGGNVACGRSDSIVFDVNKGSQPLTGTITYGDGDALKGKKRLTLVTFTCDASTEADLKFTAENPSGTYNFDLKSKHVCLIPAPTQQPPPPNPTTQPPHRREDNIVSLGTILDICLLLSMVVYVGVGFGYMYVRRGARGKEALPNYDFWIGLPGLVKEGALFIVTKIRNLRGLSSSSSSQYDAL